MDVPTGELRSGFAGGLAGAAAKTAVAPLDRVKILFQSKNPHYAQHTGSIVGIGRALGQIYTESGVRGWFQGHTAMLARIFPYAAVQFMAYEQAKAILIPTPELRNAGRSLAAGSLAGCISVLCTYPLDLIRARMAYQIRHHQQQYGWIPTCDIIAREGRAMEHGRLQIGRALANFYRGIGPTLMGIIPYGGISFMTYEAMKTCLTAPGPYYEQRRKELSGWKKLFCGAMAGTVAQTASYPLDVIRRRMQLQTQMPAGQAGIYSNSLRALRGIWAKEGLRGFYVGLTINYIKVAPTSGISYMTYEIIKRKLNV